jgi:TM2 domain-containing membrane protein YozV
MNCATHPEVPASAYCRSCGKALCVACQRTTQGTIFCEDHMLQQTAANPAQTIDSPYTAPPTAPPAGPPRDMGVSPGLAFLLGLIPGVGAIYNAQYAKGLIHVIILGVLISILSSGSAIGMEPMIGLLIAAWFAYMAFEAYHTARRRQMGEAVDEFSSIVPLHRRGVPVGPVVLIGFGLLCLAINFGWLHFYEIMRFWPVFLIALGVYMLYARMTGTADDRALGSGVSHEQR